MDYKLVVIKMEKRQESAVKVQNILTENGCFIKVRLGLHDVGSEVCSSSGLILLEVHPKEPQIDQMLAELNKIDGVIAKEMVI